MVVGAVRANAVFRSCQFFLDSENKTEKFHFFHQIKINMTGLMKGFLKWILCIEVGEEMATFVKPDEGQPS